MARKPSDDSFSEQEAARRLEAALRGARVAGHKTMGDLAKKKSPPKKTRSKKSQ
jgi:hypothetical protein